MLALAEKLDGCAKCDRGFCDRDTFRKKKKTTARQNWGSRFLKGFQMKLKALVGILPLTDAEENFGKIFRQTKVFLPGFPHSRE